MEFKELPLSKLIPSRTLRTEGIDVAELIESIREHGLLQPIRVRPIAGGMYQIIVGHRRFIAHQALGRLTISAVVVDETDREAAVQSIVENLQRENLTPLELAQGVRELATGFQLGIDEIAKLISKSEGQVRTWIRVSRLPDDILGKLESGEGRTQQVTGMTMRTIQPFVSGMPSEEERTRDPDAKVRYDETVTTIRHLTEELDKRSVRINAHMADEVARSTRSGEMTIAEAVDKVLADPDKYRYKPLYTPEQIEGDTFAEHQRLLSQMAASAYRLRTEIAVSFSNEKKHALLEQVAGLKATLDNYSKALAERGVAQSISGASEQN